MNHLMTKIMLLNLTICYHLLPFAANSAIKISSHHYRTNLQTLTTCVYKDCKISELIFESGRGTLISGLFGRTYLEEGQKERGGES